MLGRFFEAGGFGMFPTLAFGAALAAAAVALALRPGARRAWLAAALGLLTLAGGTLGFLMGVVNTLRYVQEVQAADFWRVVCLGVAESLNNVVLAVVFVVVALLAASVAALRAARTPAA